jgi:hypothetical protein
MSYLGSARSIRAAIAYLGATALPVGLLVFLNLTRVQVSMPIDGPSVPYHGFPWRACAPGVNSLSHDIDIPLMLANLALYLAVACAIFAIPALRRRIAGLPKFAILLLWAAVIVSAGNQSLTFLIGDKNFALTDHVATYGLLEQGVAFRLCGGRGATP